MFNQARFNRLMSKVDKLIKDLSTEELQCIMDSYHIMNNSSRLMPIPPRVMELQVEEKKDKSKCVPEYLQELNRNPGDRWNTQLVTGFILEMISAREDNGRYDPVYKRHISNKYGLEEDTMTNRVNTFMNDTLNKDDKWGILKEGYITKEDIIIWKYRDNQIRKACLREGTIPDEYIEILKGVYKDV